MITEFFKAERIHEFNLPYRHTFVHAIPRELKPTFIIEYMPERIIPNNLCFHDWKRWRLRSAERFTDILWAYCEKSLIFFYCYPENFIDKDFK